MPCDNNVDDKFIYQNHVIKNKKKKKKKKKKEEEEEEEEGKITLPKKILVMRLHIGGATRPIKH
jgi:hypothetical protein